MDFENLQCHMDLANFAGNTLNIDECVKLGIAVNEIRCYEKFDKIMFWGRVMGLSNDYYIVVGVKHNDFHSFPTKTFYWCTDNFKLTSLPHIDDEKRDFLRTVRGYLSGQHDKVLKSFVATAVPA